MKAVKFSGGWADGDLDNEVLWPLYEEIARLDIPILVHPGARVFEAQHSHPWLVGAERYQGFPHFPTALGFPLTYMVSAARLIFSGVLDRFPTLKFAFFEGGIGWVPWLMHTLNAHTPSEAGISVAVKQFFDGKQKIKKAPSEYFRPILYRRRLLGNLLCLKRSRAGRIITSSSAAILITATRWRPGPRQYRPSSLCLDCLKTTEKKYWAETPCGCLA